VKLFSGFATLDYFRIKVKVLNILKRSRIIYVVVYCPRSVFVVLNLIVSTSAIIRDE